ncbi:MAG: hypothetical protein KAT75_08945, partial [Dehalococcoidia bacterium]|nr:hypothetical protein [Dehalococcoidia bacterium]
SSPITHQHLLPLLARGESPLETGGRSDSSSDLSDSRKAEDSDLSEELEGGGKPNDHLLPNPPPQGGGDEILRRSLPLAC